MTLCYIMITISSLLAPLGNGAIATTSALRRFAHKAKTRYLGIYSVGVVLRGEEFSWAAARALPYTVLRQPGYVPLTLKEKAEILSLVHMIVSLRLLKLEDGRAGVGNVERSIPAADGWQWHSEQLFLGLTWVIFGLGLVAGGYSEVKDGHGLPWWMFLGFFIVIIVYLPAIVGWTRDLSGAMRLHRAAQALTAALILDDKLRGHIKEWSRDLGSRLEADQAKQGDSGRAGSMESNRTGGPGKTVAALPDRKSNIHVIASTVLWTIIGAQTGHLCSGLLPAPINFGAAGWGGLTGAAAFVSSTKGRWRRGGPWCLLGAVPALIWGMWSGAGIGLYLQQNASWRFIPYPFRLGSIGWSCLTGASFLLISLGKQFDIYPALASLLSWAGSAGVGALVFGSLSVFVFPRNGLSVMSAIVITGGIVGAVTYGDPFGLLRARH